MPLRSHRSPGVIQEFYALLVAFNGKDDPGSQNFAKFLATSIAENVRSSALCTYAGHAGVRPP